MSIKGDFEDRSTTEPTTSPRLAAVMCGLTPPQAVAWRPAMSRFENPSSTAMRWVFFANPR